MSGRTFAAAIGLAGALAIRGAPSAATECRTDAQRGTAPLRASDPASVGLEPAVLGRIDGIAADAIERGDVPGAVVLVTRCGAVVWRHAYGNRAIVPEREAMTIDTMFDLASVTKVIATLPAVFALVEEGRLRLGDPVGHYLASWDTPVRRPITLEMLLLHRAGLPPDDPEGLWHQNGRAALARLATIPLVGQPGERFLYSDLGFLVLGEIVARASGRPFADFVRDTIFAPLGMTSTTFAPGPALLARVAPTGPRREPNGRSVIVRGEAYDPRVHGLSGVAGHAGLFSTADDLAIFAQMILDRGAYAGRHVLSARSIEAMLRPRGPPGEARTVGWDYDTVWSTPRGDLLAPGGIGHTGYTGTSIWIDPATDVAIIVLTNRVHPVERRGEASPLRGRIANVVAAAIREPAAMTAAPGRPPAAEAGGVVSTGLDRSIAGDAVATIPGRRIALVTNAAAVDRSGLSAVEALRRTLGERLVEVWSPEHGLDATAQAEVPDRPGGPGLVVRSLYRPGPDGRRPTAAMMAGVDAIVVDLPDAGVRFFTYATTMGYVLEAAAATGKPVVVLDRPNPLGGLVVEGPVSEAGFASFTAYHPLALRHGMTMGELARLFNGERRLGANLRVVPMAGYRRAMWLDETGLPFAPPSPNLRSPAAVTLYPAVGLVEGTDVSVGRGTDAPFEQVGAPWIDPARLAERLRARGVPGVRFVPTRFRPTADRFAGQDCGGVRIVAVDRAALRVERLGVEIAAALRDLYGAAWRHDELWRLLGGRSIVAPFDRGEAPEALGIGWQPAVDAFLAVRRRYLIYPE